MKFLRVNSKKGEFFSKDSQWIEIDKISKEDLLFLVDSAVQNDFEMDEYEKDIIVNKAQNIIYGSLYEKFSNLLENKDRFRDESKALYKGALEKYAQE